MGRRTTPTPDLYVEDPYAPHKTSGSEARVGSAVGFLYDEPVEVTALGGQVAIGYRFGRLTLEAEYTYLAFQVRGPGRHGARRRPAARRARALRRDPARPAHRRSELAARRSTSRAAAAPRGTTGTKPAYDEASRSCPTTRGAIEGQVGFGIALDHRLQEPIGFPHRVGWFLGWRMAMSPHQPMVGFDLSRRLVQARRDDGREIASSIARCCFSRAWRSRSERCSR